MAEQLRTIYEGEVQARLELQTTKAPFRERLVQFWTITSPSRLTAELRALAGPSNEKPYVPT